MSTSVTKRMLEAYFQDAPATMFLASLFQVRPENIHRSETVEIDIERSDEDISIAIQDLSTGARYNSKDLYTNKNFTPPIHKEKFALNAFDLIKRQPGFNPFEDVTFLRNLTRQFFSNMREIARKINRSIEVQASQVLQTGTVVLNDENGNAVYSINYSPKASHFPTAGTAWGSTGDTPIKDLNSLANEIRNNGLGDVDQGIFGEDAFEAMMENTDIQNRLDTRRADLGQIARMPVGGTRGGNFRGTLDMGNFKIDVWTYGGRYKDPQTGNKVQFVDPSKVILRDSMGRLDATFGAIPNIARELGMNSTSLIPGLPSRFPSVAAQSDLTTNAWISPDGEQAFGMVGSRPLLIPTAIDTFGCLETNAS